MSDDNDWDFKLKEEDLPEEKKTVKANDGGTALKRKKKKKATKMGLDYNSIPEKKSRSAVARRQAELEREAEITEAPIPRRIFAGVIDFIIAAGLLVGVALSIPEAELHVLSFLSEQGISQSLHPDDFKNILSIAISIPLLFIFLVLPALIKKGSIGKIIMKIRIGHNELTTKASGVQILFRETIAKLISIVSIIGIFLPFFNERSKSLHDYLCGTVLYDDR